MSAVRKEVMERLRFTPDDLKYNRQGTLSPAQRESLLRGGQNASIGLAIVGVVLAIILIFAWGRDVGSPTFFIVEIVNGLFWGLLAYIALRRTRRDADEGRVESVSGQAVLRRVVKGGKLRQEFSIGSQQFSELFLPKMLDPNASYRAFYTLHSRKIVAIEPAERTQ